MSLNYDNSGYDQPMESDAQQDDDGGANGKFGMKEFGGVSKKKKRNPNQKHISVKKFVAPKNALMALMEAHAGLNFVEDSVTVESQGNVFAMSVEVNGIKFSGTGTSKDLAKHAAAEAALAGFVRGPGAGSSFTPWSSIASFAMYKLFNEWKCPLKAGRDSSGQDDASTGQQADVQMTNAEATTDHTQRKAAKALPEGAVGMNPVMLLHQMRAGITYQTSQQTDENSKAVFIVATTLDGQAFTGQASSMKKAKMELAKDAVKRLLGVNSTWVPVEPPVKN